METCIEIKGNRAYLRGNFDSDLIAKLDKHLAYRPLGYEHSPKFKCGMWGGYIFLMSSNLTFDAGLSKRVQEFFKKENIDVPIYDRNKFSKKKSIDISKNLIEINNVPREYQQRAANVALNEKRGIIRIATGGGKTLVAAMVVAEVGGEAIIYVIGKDLLHQFHSFFEKVFKTKIGIVGDGLFDVRPITIASVWSVGQAFGMKSKTNANDDEKDNEKAVSSDHFDEIRKMVANARVSILDECHIGGAKTTQCIFQATRSEYTIGMSASPYRDDNADMLIEAIFGKIIIEINASELIEKGFLVKPIIRFIKVPKLNYPPTKYREIYNEYIVENSARNNLIIMGAKKLIEQNFITLILFKEIKHGKILYKKLKENNVSCYMLSGNDSAKKRKKVIDEIKSGHCKLVLASSIFDMGVDISNLSGLILAGGGKSSVRSLQRIGRIIRLHDKKKIAAIIDFYDDIKYLKKHSLIRKKIYKRESGFKVE